MTPRTLVLLVAFALVCTAHALAPAPRSWMTTPTPRPGEWMKRHHELVKQAQAGGIDVLFAGDSITEGWGHVGQASWKKHFQPVKSANFGLSGDGTHNLLWRFQNGELDGFEARVVVLLIGTNNIPKTFENTTPQLYAPQVAEAIELLIATLRARQPKARILVHGILPRGEWPNQTRECIRLVNERLARLAEDRVHFVDLGALFLDGDHLSASVMPDFLHPNTRAYAAWAPQLAPAVKDLLNRRD